MGGALTLAQSLKRVQTTKNVVVMITQEVSENMKKVLEEVFDKVFVVDPLDSGDLANLTLLDRTELGITFTKLHCWTLIDYTKCVFLDADTLMIQNSDELFDRDEFSAAPDAGWPDCFDSGVFVFVPSLDTYQRILTFATEQGSFDGGDQGLLNMYYHNWASADIEKHLPFTYNVVSQAFYSYLPAFRHYGKNIKICHFIGRQKPWHHTFNMHTNRVEIQEEAGHCAEFLQQWWELFMSRVQPRLSSSLSDGPTLSSSTQSDGVHCGPYHSLGSTASGEGPVYTEVQLADETRQYAWERGQIDYMGIDSFENIESHIKKMMTDPEYNKSASSGESSLAETTASTSASKSTVTKQPKPILKK